MVRYSSSFVFINLSSLCVIYAEPKHRGFAFITFGSSADAQDAIDNMDMNELKGRVLRVNLARPMKGTLQPNGNRASTCSFILLFSFALYSDRSQCFSSLSQFGNQRNG